MKKSSLIILFIFVSIPFAFSQDYQSFYNHSLQINTVGMYTLGGWAVTNMVTGAIGWKQKTGATQYFYQMNFFWNVVNLGIAGYALYNNSVTDFSTWNSETIMDKHIQSENLYLINAGLDIVYMGTGMFLRHISKNKTKNKDLLKGYGNSVVLQGAFLFMFDLVMFGIQHQHQIQFLNSNDLSLAVNPQAVSLKFIF